MAQSGFTEERCIGKVTGYSAFVQPLEGREGIQKFGINFQLEPDPENPVEKSENYGKFLMFETMVGSKDSRQPTEAQKARIMEAFESLKYDPNLPLMADAQKKIVIGARAKVKVQKNNRGHWEIGFVDPLDAPARTGGGRYDPFEHKLAPEAEEDFCAALETFGREKLGITEPIRPQGRTAPAAGRAAPAAAAGRTASAPASTRAAAAPTTARAPAQRPQRQPNPDVDSGTGVGDDEIPF